MTAKFKCDFIFKPFRLHGRFDHMPTVSLLYHIIKKIPYSYFYICDDLDSRTMPCLTVLQIIKGEFVCIHNQTTCLAMKITCKVCSHSVILLQLFEIAYHAIKNSESS